MNDDHHNGSANETDSQSTGDAHPEDSQQDHCYSKQRKGSDCKGYVHAVLD